MPWMYDTAAYCTSKFQKAITSRHGITPLPCVSYRAHQVPHSLKSQIHRSLAPVLRLPFTRLHLKKRYFL